MIFRKIENRCSFPAWLLLLVFLLLCFGLDMIALAEDSPAGSPVISLFTINYGDPDTALHEVTLQLDAADDVTVREQLMVRFSNDEIEWSDWTAFQEEWAWSLSPGDGLKTVYVQVKDEDENVSTSSASIRLFVPVEGVSLDWETLMLDLDGEPIMLTATITPEDASMKELTWSSSNPAVATVSGDGLVTPVGKGEAEITVTTVDGGFTATCHVTVSDAPEIDPSVNYGDVNGDGAVDVGDAVLVLRSIVELVQLSEAQLAAADVNLDAVVDVGDAVIILRHIVGLVPSLPVEHVVTPPGEEPPVEPGPPDLPDVAPTGKLLGATYRVCTTAEVEVSVLNVRSGPGVDCSIIGSVSRGQRFIVHEERETDHSEYNRWYRINYNGNPGWIAATYTSTTDILYGLDYWSNLTRLTDAPEGLEPGDYKINSEYRFLLSRGGNLIPTDVYFNFLEQIPYARLPLDRPAPAMVTESFLAQRSGSIYPGTPFADVDIADEFMDAQETWGENAVYLMAHAALESAWGTSQIARDKNNIFGYMAYDGSAYSSAATFRSLEDCIMQVSGFIRRAYLSAGGSYFHGPHLVGMNEKYATDPMWAIKIARIMQSILNFSEYTLVEKELAKGVTDASVKLRTGPGTSYAEIATLPAGTSVEILGSKLISSVNWLKVNAGERSGWLSGDYVELVTCPRAAVYFADWYKEGEEDTKLRVRSGPGTNYDIKDNLKFGHTFTITGIDSDWYQISYSGATDPRWVSAEYVIVNW